MKPVVYEDKCCEIIRESDLDKIIDSGRDADDWPVEEWGQRDRNKDRSRSSSSNGPGRRRSRPDDK